MKNLLAALIVIWLTGNAFGQINRQINIPSSTGTKTESEEAAAFRNFNFDKLEIQPNNLDQKTIKDLRQNFLPAVKSLIVETGDYPARISALAKEVFRLHKTTKSQIVVFNHSTPTVFTWKETFITFSTAAADLLSDDEITALIAHEVGHLYFAEELAQARLKKDGRSERVIELKCDLVALYTLSKLKIDGSSLISAVEKLIALREQMNVNSFQIGSPTFESRKKLSKFYNHEM